MGILEILGFILLCIVGKFIYDTYLTENTNDTWKWYKENHPEEAYRLERNKGLDFNVNPKNKINDKKRSIQEIAINLNTTPELVREKYIESLKLQVTSQDEKRIFLNLSKEQKIQEAKTKGIDPDDGIAALMERWAIEYFNSDDFNINIMGKADKEEYQELLDAENALEEMIKIYRPLPETKNVSTRINKSEAFENEVEEMIIQLNKNIELVEKGKWKNALPTFEEFPGEEEEILKYITELEDKFPTKMKNFKTLNKKEIIHFLKDHLVEWETIKSFLFK